MVDVPHSPAPTQEPHWLTDDQQRVWRSWLRGTSQIENYMAQQLRPHGLDLAEYEILVELSEAPERECRMSHLADGVHQSRSRLTHTVTRLEKAGLVTRRRCKGDGRGVWATLTDEGMALLEAVAPSHVQAVRDVFIDVVDPDDFAAIGRAMEAVLALDVEVEKRLPPGGRR